MTQMSFGQCLKRILKDRNCTVAQLQRKLGYKSATTISRIIHDTSSALPAERLLRQLLLTNFLSLREDEISALERALKTSASQELSFAAVYQKLNTLFFAPSAQPEILLQEIKPSGIRWLTLAEWMESLQGAARIDGILLGNFLPGLLQNLVAFCSVFPPDTVKIQHFFEAGTGMHELAELMLSVHSIFLHPWYEAFINKDEKRYMGNAPAFARDTAVFRVETKQRETVAYEMRLMESSELYIWRNENTAFPYAALEAIIASSGKFRMFYPLRKEAMVNHDVSDLLTMYRRSYFMERHRTQRVISQTMCISYIQPEIMLNHGHEFLGAPVSENQEIVTPFMELHTSRHENNYAKKCPTYMILSKESMARFAREGVMADHPHGFSPFSISERITILAEFIDNCQNNPYFHVYMADDTFRFGSIYYAGFSNFGLYFFNAATDYNIQEPVHEALISNNDILRLYERYFDGELLRKHVDSEAASLAFLKDLLRGL